MNKLSIRQKKLLVRHKTPMKAVHLVIIYDSSSHSCTTMLLTWRLCICFWHSPTLAYGVQSSSGRSTCIVTGRSCTFVRGPPWHSLTAHTLLARQQINTSHSQLRLAYGCLVSLQNYQLLQTPQSALIVLKILRTKTLAPMYPSAPSMIASPKHSVNV